MTAIAAYVTGAAGFMVTDSVVTDEAGIAVAHGFKVATCPHASTVVATRGPLDGCWWAAEIAARYASFDEIEREAPAAFKLEYEKLAEQLGPRGMDIIVMGYSEAAGVARLYIAASPEFVFQAGPIIAAPTLTPGQCAAAGISGLDGPADLLRIMEIQRRIPDDDGRFLIGGIATLTGVSNNGIAQQIVHRWPDKIGERIEPQSPTPL